MTDGEAGVSPGAEAADDIGRSPQTVLERRRGQSGRVTREGFFRHRSELAVVQRVADDISERRRVDVDAECRRRGDISDVMDVVRTERCVSRGL